MRGKAALMQKGVLGNRPGTAGRIASGGSALLPITILFFVVIMGAGSVQAQTSRPAWLDDPTKAYPPEEYLVGVGSGASADEAAVDARASLAAGFRARVRSTKTVWDEVAESFSREENTYKRRSHSRRATEVETSENLANITMGGTWFDETNGRYHALAYIRRDEAEQIIGADIQACLVRIAELLNCPGCYPDVLAEYAGAYEAVTRYGEYEDLCSQLRVVTEGQAGDIDSGLRSRVGTWLVITGKRLTLQVKAAPEDLEPQLRQCLLETGFVVVDENALFVAELTYVTEPTQYTEPFVFEKWEMSLRIRRARDGSDLVTLNKNDRAGHKTRPAAQERCLRAAREILTAEFRVELESFLTDSH